MKAVSAFVGTDKELLPKLIAMHCDPTNPLILDATHNQGTMWKGLSYRVVSMDIDPQHRTQVVADFAAMPFAPATFDVVVFDPPHLPVAAGSANSSGLWRTRYGLTDSGDGREGDNVSGMFAPFLAEAQRVLKPGGIVLAKVADLVHNHRYQWQHVDFINAVQATAMTACDMVIKIDPNAGNLMSSKWETAHHFRKNHCYWIVVRNAAKCEGRGNPMHDHQDFQLGLFEDVA